MRCNAEEHRVNAVAAVEAVQFREERRGAPGCRSLNLRCMANHILQVIRACRVVASAPGRRQGLAVDEGRAVPIRKVERARPELIE